MLIAHLADLHLGYRAYHRVNARGVNAREADVAEAFREAIDATVRLEPDLVLIAGDVFHTVRPSNGAIADAFRQLSSLTARLPGVPVVLIAGNHDSPRSTDTGNILQLFREIPGLHVVTEEAQRVRLEELDASVLCLPHNALARQEEIDLAPDPEVGTNVLMLHGTVAGDAVEGKIRYVSEYGGVAVLDSAIAPERWDYVALGHYHIATELAPNMWYSGGIERTSTNIWAETGPKGFVSYDTDRGAGRFHPVATRTVVDLERISARGRTAQEVDAAIAASVESIPDGTAGKIVRLVVEDIPRHVVRELDHRRVREYKAEALHFHLDARPPQVRRIVGSGAPMRRQTLREQVEGFLSRHWAPSSDAIDRDRLVALARHYLDEVGEVGE
ncbi:MAG TPA: DNA repair exonuclease [Longimicrobiaceae bacterium]|nr:DNA repair exonuclease [Longimicrobiaceae bacterium]